MIELNCHFDGKNLVPDKPIKLPKNTVIRVRANVVKKGKKKKASFVIGKNPVLLGLTDLSENLDKYLYKGSE